MAYFYEIAQKKPLPQRVKALSWRLDVCNGSEADSSWGASVGTSATLGAFVRIDGVDVAFGDSSNGALINAGAACYTVVTDYVSHNCLFFKGYSILFGGGRQLNCAFAAANVPISEHLPKLLRSFLYRKYLILMNWGNLRLAHTHYLLM